MFFLYEQADEGGYRPADGAGPGVVRAARPAPRGNKSRSRAIYPAGLQSSVCALSDLAFWDHHRVALRRPGPEFVTMMDEDPSYRVVYIRQVEIARILMMCTVINRTKIV